MDELKLTVVATQEIAPLVRQITLQNSSGEDLPIFAAGAHIKVIIPDGSLRHYSLVQLATLQAPPKEYQLGIRLEEDSKGGSRYMHSLAFGDTVTCQSPTNDFPLQTPTSPPLFIAGGIGVTPITGMLTALQDQDFVFHYAGRAAGSLAFLPELQALAGDRMTVNYDNKNPLDLDQIFANFDAARPVYVCGPKGMIEAVKTAAFAAGVPADNIHFELFTSEAEATGDTAFEVKLSSTGTVYTIPAGQTIVEVLEAADVDIMFDYQRGDCGICQVEVLQGTPDHRDVVLSDDEKAAGDVMQICVSRSKTPRLVLDI